MDSNGGKPRRLLSVVLQWGERCFSGFDWYRGSRHAVYTRYREDGSGGRELVARDLESDDREVVLFRGAPSEPSASPDGRAIAFCVGPNLRQDLWVLRLRPPDAPDGLPEPIGKPQQLTDGKGAWHAHFPGWSPNGEEIVYTHAAPESEILVIENYR